MKKQKSSITLIETRETDEALENLKYQKKLFGGYCSILWIFAVVPLAIFVYYYLSTKDATNLYISIGIFVLCSIITDVMYEKMVKPYIELLKLAEKNDKIRHEERVRFEEKKRLEQLEEMDTNFNAYQYQQELERKRRTITRETRNNSDNDYWN